MLVTLNNLSAFSKATYIYLASSDFVFYYSVNRNAIYYLVVSNINLLYSRNE